MKVPIKKKTSLFKNSPTFVSGAIFEEGMGPQT